MLFSWTNFCRTGATATLTTVYLHNNANGAAAIKEIELVNSSTLPVQAWVYIVPDAATAGYANAVVPGWTVQPSGNKKWNGFKVLVTTGDTVQVRSSSNGAIAIHVDGGRYG